MEHDQTLCPKCGRMYCEGFWSEGVCISDMHFCGEPTADFDAKGEYLRVWYEKHRETWWDRSRYSKNQQLLNAGCADEFILGLLNEVRRIEEQATKVKRQ
jgi:hypothetical protein